jgi:hypothetical protein
VTTFLALRTQCASRYRDTNNNVVSDTQWKDYVNQAYQEANAFTPLWPWLETSEQTMTITPPSRSSALPADVFQVNWVYDTTDNLELIPQEGRGDQWRNQNLRTDTGTPVSYRLRNATIEVFPIPTAVTTIVAECNLMPIRLSADGDLPVWPANWHELLIPGALALAFLDDGNTEFHQAQDQRFRRQLGEMQAALLSFRTETYTAVRDSFWG